jgi:hypothetical protein
MLSNSTDSNLSKFLIEASNSFKIGPGITTNGAAV